MNANSTRAVVVESGGTQVVGHVGLHAWELSLIGSVWVRRCLRRWDTQALDLIDGKTTERTELAMVKKTPFPFPPEPLRWLGVSMTRRAIQRADRRQGRRGPWLRILDRLGVGFDL